MTNVVIASAARTAVGSFSGSFADTPAHNLGAAVLEALVERAGVGKDEVDQTILGQVLTAGFNREVGKILEGFDATSVAIGGLNDLNVPPGVIELSGSIQTRQASAYDHGFLATGSATFSHLGYPL